MRFFLLILSLVSLLTLLGGVGVMLIAKSAIHEILAGVLFIISAITISGAGIVTALQKVVSEVSLAIAEIRALRKLTGSAYEDQLNADEVRRQALVVQQESLGVLQRYFKE